MQIKRHVSKKNGATVQSYVLVNNPLQLVGKVDNSDNSLQLYLVPEVTDFNHKAYTKLISAAKRRHGISGVNYNLVTCNLE